jgi:pantoate kinase
MIRDDEGKHRILEAGENLWEVLSEPSLRQQMYTAVSAANELGLHGHRVHSISRAHLSNGLVRIHLHTAGKDEPARHLKLVTRGED